ncbi:DUF481 domain-containing protein [Luteimonas aquatica]|uniref:DUF481 domain-containing protein n=1 Tax=Luteimonas aquatica TaxID=450364 RepID=UPI001F58B0C7|nr:DUF481 domain-containing protein [Luteimonas aquatica]
MTCKSLLSLLLAAAPLSALAQEAAPAADTGWTATGELGLALARGNARSENLNAKLSLGKEDAQWKHAFYGTALRAKGEVTGDFDGDGIEEEKYELSANRYELGASSAYKFDPRNYIVGALRYENDDFSTYEYQATASIGYGRKFVDNDRTQFVGEIGPGFRRARNAETGQIEDGAIARGLLDLKHKLTDNTELYNTFLVESGSDNTFMQNDLGVSVAMNDRFALKAGLQARRNSQVDELAGEKKTDTLTTVNLVYKIR